jgi:hypothetical protein
VEKVQWKGDLGTWKAYAHGGKTRYDLVQRTGGKLFVYYGVTEDGLHGAWRNLVGAQPTAPVGITETPPIEEGTVVEAPQESEVHVPFEPVAETFEPHEPALEPTEIIEPSTPAEETMTPVESAKPTEVRSELAKQPMGASEQIVPPEPPAAAPAQTVPPRRKRRRARARMARSSRPRYR